MPLKNPKSRAAYERRRVRENRARWAEEGKCVECGKNPPAPMLRHPERVGKVCAECRTAHAAFAKKYRERVRPAFKALGFCILCLKRKRMQRSTRCAVCHEVQEDYYRRVTRERQLAARVAS